MNKLTTQQITTLLQSGKLFRMHKDDKVQFYIKKISDGGDGAWALFSKHDVIPGIDNLGSVAFYPHGITVTKRASKNFRTAGTCDFSNIIFLGEDIAEMKIQNEFLGEQIMGTL